MGNTFFSQVKYILACIKSLNVTAQIRPVSTIIVLSYFRYLGCGHAEKRGEMEKEKGKSKG